MLFEYFGKLLLSKGVTGFVSAEAFGLTYYRHVCRIGNCQQLVPEFKLSCRSHIRCAFVDVDYCEVSYILGQSVICFDCVFSKCLTRLRAAPYRTVSYNKQRIFFVNIKSEPVNLFACANFSLCCFKLRQSCIPVLGIVC